MTSDDTLPAPPGEIPKYIREPVQKQSPERLRILAQYAEELANAKEQQREQDQAEKTDSEDDVEDEDISRDDEDLPDDVPRRATKTQKTINDNQYWYWQWREGDKIKSEYIKPVNPD